MRNNKICTSIEQSKKLIELGIDVNTADMVYCVELYKEGWKYSNEAYPIDGTLEGDDIPSWSLSALLELMPQWTLNGFANGKFNCRDDRAEKYALVDTCPLDAAFDMVCWLLENNKI